MVCFSAALEVVATSAELTASLLNGLRTSLFSESKGPLLPRFSLGVLVLAPGCRSTPPTALPRALAAAEESARTLPSSLPESAQQAAQDLEPLVVLGIREELDHIAIVSRSPDDRWRALNARGSPCDECMTALSSVPEVFLRTTLRCARVDGRRRTVSTDVRGLDAAYHPLTATASRPRPELCELTVVVEDRRQGRERRTSFCAEPGTPIAEASEGPCDFPEVRVPDTTQIRPEKAVFEPEDPAAISYSADAAEPPRLHVTLDVVHGLDPYSFTIDGELICRGQKTTVRARTSADAAVPGDGVTMPLRFDLPRGHGVVGTCELLLSETRAEEHPSRFVGTFCLQSSVQQARTRRRSGKPRGGATSVLDELDALARPAEGDRAPEVFSVQAGPCEEQAGD